MKQVITIIVPVYNVEQYLERCIDSIISQTYSELEIIIIDDGSTDGSGIICDNYSTLDSRITVIHQKNKGLSAARNAAIEISTGTFITFVDSDDWIEPNMIEMLLSHSLNQDLDLICCGWYVENDKKRRTNQLVESDLYIEQEHVLREFARESFGGTVWGKIWKADLLKDNVRFPEGHVYEDLATLWKLVLKCRKVYITSYCGYHYYQRRDSITHTRTINHFMDRWHACYEFYQICLSMRPKERNILLPISVKNCATAASYIWRWAYIESKFRRSDQSFIDVRNEANRFVRNNIKHFLNNDYTIYTKIGLVFVCFNNDISLACCFLLNNLHRMLPWLSKGRI